MNAPELAEGPLAGLRVLEFDSPLTAHAGHLLWEMGADVVLVEPPTGSPMRGLGAGAVFAHHHAGKRAIAFDTDANVRRLLADADVALIAPAPDGIEPDAGDLAHAVTAHPELISVVVAPFGTTGPRAHWHASDLVVSALGGLVAQIGWPDGPPRAAPADQAWHLAALNAVIGALLALAARARGGTAPHVEVSALECVAASLEAGALLYIHADGAARRTGTAHPLAPHRLFRAADGWLAGGLGGNPRMWDGLLDWMAETGEDGDLRTEAMRDPERLPSQRDHVFDVIEQFTRTRARGAVFHEAQRRRLPWAAVADVDDVATSPQLAARGALVPVAFDGRTGLDVAPPIRRADAARVSPARSGGDETSWTARAVGDDAVSAHVSGAAPVRGALDNVTVLDLTWVLAGPYATRILADHGARVVKVESRHRPDPTRFSRFSHLSRGEFDPDTSGYFNNVNRNKASITLNLRAPAGVETFLRLVERADVVIDNFSAGSLDRLGLGADLLHERNPGLVVVSMSGLGATGPWRDYVSYADAIGALCGFTALCNDGTNTERLAPVVHGLADIVAGHHAALATLAALAQRRRTGRGCAVDLSQLEAMAVQTGPALLARTTTGAAPERRSTSMPRMAPEGVYRCLGPDRWVAITVTDDCAWRALCRVIARPDLDALAPVEQRVERANEIDAAIAAWTAPRSAPLVAEFLQAAGVAAGMVQDGRDLVEHDPQLRARGFYPVVEHPRAGAFVHEGVPIRLAATPGGVWEPAPLLGADTDSVLRDLGGLSATEIEALRATGALE